MAETIHYAQKFVAGRGSGKESVLLWSTSLKTAIGTEGSSCRLPRCYGQPVPRPLGSLSCACSRCSLTAEGCVPCIMPRGQQSRLLYIADPRIAPLPVPAGFLSDHSAELAALVLETLPAYELKAQQRAVNQWVRSALADEAFLKAFAAVLLKACAAKQPPQNAFKLLEWSCLVLERLPSGSTKAVQKLIEAQGGLLDILFHISSSHVGQQQRWQAAKRAVFRLLRNKPELFADYLAVAAGVAGTPGLVTVTLEAGLRQPGKQQHQQQSNAAVDVLLPVLCDKVLAAREAPKAVQLAAFSPLLSTSLTAEQLTQQLIPAACKAIRRTPEPAITALAGVLGYVQLDISSAAPELVNLLLQQLRAKEAVRGVSEQDWAAARLTGSADIHAPAPPFVTATCMCCQ